MEKFYSREGFDKAQTKEEKDELLELSRSEATREDGDFEYLKKQKGELVTKEMSEQEKGIYKGIEEQHIKIGDLVSIKLLHHKGSDGNIDGNWVNLGRDVLIGVVRNISDHDIEIYVDENASSSYIRNQEVTLRFGSIETIKRMPPTQPSHPEDRYYSR